MSAPTRAPHYYNWDGDGMPAAEGMAFYIDSFASHPKYFAEWIVEDFGIEVDLTLVAHQVGESCTIGFAGGGLNGTVTFAADPSGWVLVTAEVGGTEIFRGYLDRPYEQYEIWPAGATPGPQDEGPGRIGKREAWIGLPSEVWPALAPLGDERGHLYVTVDEARLRVRMDAEQ